MRAVLAWDDAFEEDLEFSEACSDVLPLLVVLISSGARAGRIGPAFAYALKAPALASPPPTLSGGMNVPANAAWVLAGNAASLEEDAAPVFALEDSPAVGEKYRRCIWRLARHAA